MIWMDGVIGVVVIGIVDKVLVDDEGVGVVLFVFGFIIVIIGFFCCIFFLVWNVECWFSGF